MRFPKRILRKVLLALLAATWALTAGRAEAGLYDSAEFPGGVQGVPSTERPAHLPRFVTA